MAAATDRAQVEAIVAEDPFHQHGLAEFRIIEFRASQRAPDLANYLRVRDQKNPFRVRKKIAENGTDTKRPSEGED